MTLSPQHAAALRLLEQTGILKSNYAPPLFRLLWRAGVPVPPPHFMSFFAAAASTGLAFGTMFGLFMVSFAAALGEASPLRQVWACVSAGVMFGIAMASYYAYGRRKYQLPEWSVLAQSGGDAEKAVSRAD